MMPFGLHTPSGFWLALLAIPLIIFYFLKLRRPRVMIPSLALWLQVLNDNRVNSPFQRFKRNILLLVQLLCLLLIVLAATQPFWRGREAEMDRLPILIDCSASMAAFDKPGGTTRLAAAKKQIGELIDELPSGRRICLIAFSNSARRLTGFTDNKRELRDTLDALTVDDVSNDVESAFRMAQSLGRTEPFDTVMLFSDGNLPDQVEVDLAFRVDYVLLPAAGPNVGITALNATRGFDEAWSVFLQLEGKGDPAPAAKVKIIEEDGATTERAVLLDEDNSQRMMFSVPAPEGATIRVRLEPDGFDSLASDNEAFVELPAVRSLWAYVPPTLPAFRHALRGLKGVRVYTGDEVSGQTSYDLVVTDRQADMVLDARVRLLVGMVPEKVAGYVNVESAGTQVVDWRKDAVLLQHVDLTDLIILDRPYLATNARLGDLENLGFDTLVHGARGPLLLETRGPGTLSFYMLFHTDRSTLPYRVGFPIMASNLAQIALREVGLAEARGRRTGVLPPVNVLATNSEYKVEGPGGLTMSATSDPSGMLAGIAAPRVGMYRLSGGTDVREVGAALLNTDETRLGRAEKIYFNEQLSVQASADRPNTDRALWPMAVMIGFLVLLVEWWIYQRKPGGVTS